MVQCFLGFSTPSRARKGFKPFLYWDSWGMHTRLCKGEDTILSTEAPLTTRALRHIYILPDTGYTKSYLCVIYHSSLASILPVRMQLQMDIDAYCHGELPLFSFTQAVSRKSPSLALMLFHFPKTVNWICLVVKPCQNR
jgi:hypothetical protein